jgi:hypothetical protein
VGLLEGDDFHDCQPCRRDGLQQIRGCPELSREHPHIHYEIDGEVVRHCLVQEVTSQSLTWIQECNYIEVGILPEPGGLNNQWEQDLRAFGIINAERAALKKQ